LNVYVPSPPKRVSFSTFQSELADLISDHVGESPFLLGGDFNAHLDGRNRSSTRDAEFCRFVSDCTNDGFRVFPEPGSSVPTFVSSRGVTVIDFYFSRGFRVSGREARIRVFEDIGHRALEMEVEIPKFRLHSVGPRSSYRRHVRTVPPPTFFNSMCRSYGWKGPLEILQAGVTTVFNTFFSVVSCISALHITRIKALSLNGNNKLRNVTVRTRTA
jgi:hypothetical protein